MAHSHGEHGHRHDLQGVAARNIRTAFWLNTVFAVVEVAGGLYTNSISILSDALHDLGDSLSLGFAYYFQRTSEKKADQKYSYGYRRFSVIGAFVNSMVLIAGSVFIISEAVSRLQRPEQPDAKGMVVLAILGLGVNLAAMLRLRRGKSVNEQVVSLHFLEDVLGWAAVLIGALVMMFVDVPVLDPILSLAIACFILFNVFRNLRSASRIVLQGVPSDVSEQEIRDRLAEVKEISDVHDFHVWSLDGIYNVLTLHVAVHESVTMQQGEAIKKKIRQRLLHLNIRHATIELESSDANCRLGNTEEKPTLDNR